MYIHYIASSYTYICTQTHTNFFLSQTLSIYFPVVLFFTHNFLRNTPPHMQIFTHRQCFSTQYAWDASVDSIVMRCDTHTYTHRQCFSIQYACDASVDTIDVRRDTDRTFMLLTDLVGLEGTLSTCLPSCSPILWRLDLAMPAPNFPFSPNKPGWKKNNNHIFN